MKTSINKLRTELKALVDANEMINSFYWKDLLRAMSETSPDYAMVAVHYKTAGLVVNQDRIQLEISACDVIDKDWNENLNDVESDTFNYLRQIYNGMQSVRWKKIGRIEQATVNKFIAEGKDYVAGHTMTMTFLLRDLNGVCDLPFFDYDFDQIVTNNTSVIVFNSDMSYSVTVDCGSELELPDITYTIKDTAGNNISTGTIPSVNNIEDVIADATAVLKNSEGTILSTTNILAEGSQDITAPDGTAENSDSSFSLAVPSGTTKIIPDITVEAKNSAGTVLAANIAQPSAVDAEITVPDVTHTDSDGSPVVKPGGVAMVCTPSVVPLGAKILKTGQTTSYATGDDGDIEAGRPSSFTVLASNNPFGNTNRFTDELGGQTYTNGIILDWTTYDSNEVMAYYVLLGESFNSGCANISGYTLGTYGGWRFGNIHEAYNVADKESSDSFNYAPFSFSSNVITSTTYAANTSRAHLITSTGLTSSIGKSNTNVAFAVREFTNAELGI